MRQIFFISTIFSLPTSNVFAFQTGNVQSFQFTGYDTRIHSSPSTEAEIQQSESFSSKPPDMEAYASGYSTVFEEQPALSCKPTFGEIPTDLVGTYFRSGPAMFSAGSLPPPRLALVKPDNIPVSDGKDPNRMVKHPFEGDGAILGVTFSGDGSATSRFRYVRTAGFTSERKRGAKLYKGMDTTRESDSGIGNDTPLPLYRHHLQPGLNKNRKNTSNTRSIYWAKKLLTLWEGGLPYKLDSLALSTEGKSQLGGVLKPDTPFCSKGAYDAANDRMLFYDNKQESSSSQLTVYEFNSKFRLVSEGDEGKVSVKLPGTALLSDFAVTENYSIFIQPPISTNGLQYMMSKEPGKTLSLDSNGNALLHLVPRVSSSKYDAGLKTYPIPLDGFPEAECQFVNAYEENNGGTIVLDVIRSDGKVSSSSTKWPWTSSISDYNKSNSKKSLWRYTIEVSAGSIKKRRITDTQAYFGVVNPVVSGQKHQFIYAAVGALGDKIAPPQGIVKYICDDENSSLDETWFPNEYEFCGEPMYAPRKQALENNSSSETKEDDGYIISVLYNGKEKKSEIIILLASNIKAGPIARIPLGMAIPHGYYGCFASSEEADWDFEAIDRRARLGDKMEAKGSMWNEVKSDFSGLGLRLDDFEEYFGDML